MEGRICPQCGKSAYRFPKCPWCGSSYAEIAEGSQPSSTVLTEKANRPAGVITVIAAIGIQVIGVIVLLLLSTLAVGGDGSKGGFIFVNGLNLLVVAYTSSRAIAFLSSNNSSGAIGVVMLTVPLAFLLYFAIGVVVLGLRVFGVQVG